MESNSCTVFAIFRHFYPVLAGASERFRRYAPGLKTHGIRLVIVTTDTDQDADPEILKEMEVVRVSVESEDHVVIDRALIAATRALLIDLPRTQRPVVQLISGYTALMPDLIRLRLRGVKTVFVGTMVEPGVVNQHGLRANLKTLLRRMALSLSFDHFVASSELMAFQQQRNGARRKSTTVIPNGVDLKRFQPLESEDRKVALREEMDLPGNALIGLFAGNIIHRKGVDLLIEAWQTVNKSYPDAMLLLVGPLERPTMVSSAERDELSQFQQLLFEASGNMLNQQIHFLGEKQDIERYFQISDFFVLPSRKEGLGNVVLEAMACRLPILMTDYLGRPTTEFGQPDDQYLLSSLEPSELAEKIIRLIRDPSLRQRLGNAAHDWCIQHLGLDSTLEKFSNIYLELAGKPGKLNQ